MSKTEEFIKAPRLYVENDLGHPQDLELSASASHYLCTVMRLKAGDPLRLFNGRDGEWGYALTAAHKKHAIAKPLLCLYEQPAASPRIHLLFAPIKKARMDFLIEKAVELGVTDLHPVFTQNTEVRKINAERLQAQITEAAEQCERLDLPQLHDAITFSDFMAAPHAVTPLPPNTAIFAAIERQNAPPLHIATSQSPAATPRAVLIGPEGGFTKEEQERLAAQEAITAVTLGSHILRAETAAIKALSLLTAGA